MSKPLGSIPMLLLLALVVAIARASTVDLNSSSVSLQPQGAWTLSSGACGTTSTWTTGTDGASITFPFTGNSIVVSGFQTTSTGTLNLTIDGQFAGSWNLSSSVASCSTSISYVSASETNDAHTATLALVAAGVPTTMDISQISYNFVIRPTPASATSRALPIASTTFASTPFATSRPVPAFRPSNNRNVGTIVGAVVGAVAGVLLIGGILFWLYRKRRSASYGRRAILIYHSEPAPQVSMVVPTPVVILVPEEDTKSEVDAKIADLEACPPSYTLHPGTMVDDEKTKH